ncbi:MAG: hypothetical protein LUG51_05835 [Tannerellaceae bacterium]|nr:hypothetical protein [Tannerellaceae bacterium]
MGTLLSILFLIWFLSGFVMIYHTFPKVEEREKWKNKEPIPLTDLPAVQEIFQWVPSGETIHSLTIEKQQGQILFHVGTHKDKFIFPADRSQTVLPVTGETIRQTASRWYPEPIERIDTLYQVDQWIPFGRLKAEFPIYKFHYADALRHQLYISSRTGEVLQLTTKKAVCGHGSAPSLTGSISQHSASGPTTGLRLSSGSQE